MKKILVLMLGLVFSGFAIAQGASKDTYPGEYQFATHRSILAGLLPGEGRIIRAASYENNKFQHGYFFCAGADSMLYEMTYGSPRMEGKFHAEHLMKFSICQDETLAECQEFASDKFIAFRNAEGFFEFDSLSTAVDISPVKDAFKACAPELNRDELVKKSMYNNDRRFAHVG